MRDIYERMFAISVLSIVTTSCSLTEKNGEDAASLFVVLFLLLGWGYMALFES